MYADPRGPRCIMRYLFVKFDDVRDLRDPGRPPVTIQVRPLYIGIRLVSIDNTRDNRQNMTTPYCYIIILSYQKIRREKLFFVLLYNCMCILSETFFKYDKLHLKKLCMYNFCTSHSCLFKDCKWTH